MNRRLRRLLAGIVAATFLCTLLASCGGGGSSPSPITPPSGDVEVTYTAPAEENIVEDVLNEGAYYVNNEILLTAADNITKDDVAAIVRQYSGSIVGYIELTNDYQIKFPSNTYTLDQIEEIASELQTKDGIEDAQVHYLYETNSDAVPNDAKWASEEWSAQFPEGSNWGVEAIDAMGAWDHRSSMETVRVGIIDSMFDENHEDVQFAKVWNNPTSLDSGSRGSHGTHVAGTIAATYDNGKGIAGIAPTAELYGYSIMGEATDASAENMISGFMEWKYAIAKLLTSNCRVINVSMGLAYPNEAASELWADILTPYLSKLLDKDYDFLIVQAAGNDAVDAVENGIFCGITDQDVKDHILVVGAVANNGSHQNDTYDWLGERVFDGYRFADFSNYGSRVDVVAPGCDILSTVSNNGYESWSGTSMATPHVTAIAADCFAVNPALSGAQVKQIILTTGSCYVSGISHNGVRDTDGYAMVNANEAVECALTTSGGAIAPVNPANGVIMGSVKGSTPDGGSVGLQNAIITAQRTSTYDGNLADTAATAVADLDGSYELILEAGTYYINIYCEGYLPVSYSNVVLAEDETKVLDQILLPVDNGEDNGSEISGYVQNALGGTVSGATIKLRAGFENKTGALAKQYNSNQDAVTTSNSYGYYSITMPEGFYTAEFSKAGFVTGYANIVCSRASSTNQNGEITPVMDENEYRIVLRWGETPRDLDSHLTGPLSTGGRFHVLYYSKLAYDNSELVAQLDLDDTSSYGPETITLHRSDLVDGVYRYAVHDFTNRNSTQSNELSMSGAKVVVYHGNEAIATFNVPVNQGGTVWNVFEIRNGVLYPINTMEYIASPSSVAGGSTTFDTYALDSFDYEEKKETESEEAPADEEFLDELDALDLPVDGSLELF